LDACQLQLAILYNADHVNIIQLLGSEHKSGFFHFFLEYVPGGTLTNCIQLHGNLEEETTKFFLRQILAGLEYLHTNDVIHGNLQAEHILITDTGVCKITGFGLARHITIDDYASIPLENFVFWMAPELPPEYKKDYDNRIDTWSIGCVVHELWTGQPPWQCTGLGPMSVLRQLYFSRQTPPLPDTILVSLLAGDFRNRCFLAEPGERPSAELLMKHPYLTLTPGWQFKGFSADPEPDVR
ncbi:kinase-like protein, partial [Wolfiporia cocos MD-104 SS10]